MLRFTLLIGMLGVISWLPAQTTFDAYRFSQFQVGGTARTLGIGGGIGALGADFATLSSNPAGIGSFRRSEFTFSPEIFSSRSTSVLEGTEASQDETKNNFNISNLGFVFTSRPSASKWTTFNFGVGINRTANFNQSVFYQGVTPGSRTDRFRELADGFTSENLNFFEEGLAWETGAIYTQPSTGNDFYYSDFTNGEPVQKSEVIRTTGAVTELEFAFGGNFQEKIQFGATLGIPFLNFEEEKVYREWDPDDQNVFFEELIYGQNLDVSGRGVNIKAGFIYKPVHALRLGAAVHSPTFYGIDEEYTTTMIYEYTDGGPVRNQSDSPDGFYEYRLRTPMRLLGSAGLVIQKIGFLSAEVEWADYSTTRFNFNRAASPEDLSFEQELNRQVQEQFQSAITMRLGGELALDIFRVRAGYNLIGSAFAGDNFYNSAFTAGVGIREQNFFLDLGYRRAATNESYVPYEVTNDFPQQLVTTDVLGQHFLVTFGFKL